MNAPYPVHLVVRASLHALVQDVVRRCYIERLKRAGWEPCWLCGTRNDPERATCDRCHALQVDDVAPCTACGQLRAAHEIEDRDGYCACGARWVCLDERSPAPPTHAELDQVFGDDCIPF